MTEPGRISDSGKSAADTVVDLWLEDSEVDRAIEVLNLIPASAEYPHPAAQRIFEKRYNMSYEWFYKREHINLPNEIREEILRKFDIASSAFFPLLVPSVTMNLCIGITATPRAAT